MKKLLLMAALTITAIVSASTRDAHKGEEIMSQIENVNKFVGNWGCYGEFSLYDDWSGEWVVIKTFEICCYDTSEQACAAVEQELTLVSNNY